MSEQYKIWWVDDSEERERDATNLADEGAGLVENLSVDFWYPEELLQELVKPEEDERSFSEEPDLILIDWFLSDDGGYHADSLSLEGWLRDEFTEIPIYGFSADFDDRSFERRRGIERFDLLFALDELTAEDSAEKVIEDINDYRKLQKLKGADISDLLSAMDVPENEEDKIVSALPSEFKHGIPAGEQYESGGILRLARWIRDKLRDTPGPLWDEKLTATKLGITQSGFEKVSSRFSDAEYKGVFSEQNARHWWRIKVISIISGIGKDQGIHVEAPWEAGPELLGVPEEVAICSVCKNPHPETLAYSGLPDDSERFPVHFRCSKIDTPREGVFDDHRIVSEEESE